MKRKALLFFICITLLESTLFAQDSVKDVIAKVFSEKKVSEIIFFDYKGEGEWPHRLKDGHFAFIMPDSVFQKLYADIFIQLAYSWPEEKMLQNRTYIKTENGTAFVRGNFFNDDTMRLVVRIDQIAIGKTEAFLEFHTTSQFVFEEMKKKYVKISAKLKRKRNGWNVKSVKTAYYPCCDDLFPEYR